MSKKVALPIAADYLSITSSEQLSLPCAWPRPPSLAALRQFTLKEGGICRRQKTEGLLIAVFAAEAALQSPTAYRRSPLCTRGPWVRVKYGANLAKNVYKRQTRQTTTSTRSGTKRQISSRCFSFRTRGGTWRRGVWRLQNVTCPRSVILFSRRSERR